MAFVSIRFSEVYRLARNYSEVRSTMLTADTACTIIPRNMNRFADLSTDPSIDPATLSDQAAIIYRDAEQEEKAKRLFMRYQGYYDQYQSSGIAALQAAERLFQKEPDSSVVDVVNRNIGATLQPDASDLAKRHRQMSEEVLALTSGEGHDPLATESLRRELGVKLQIFHEQGEQVAQRFGWE